MNVLSLAQYVIKELNQAYGGVLNWSEADAFEGIYKVCEEIIEQDKKQIRAEAPLTTQEVEG